MVQNPMHQKLPESGEMSEIETNHQSVVLTFDEVANLFKMHCIYTEAPRVYPYTVLPLDRDFA